MSTRLRGVTSAVALTALLLAGCGDTDDSSEASSPSTEVSAETTDDAPADNETAVEGAELAGVSFEVHRDPG